MNQEQINSEIIANLKEAGSDISKIHEIDFKIISSNEQDANAIIEAAMDKFEFDSCTEIVEKDGNYSFSIGLNITLIDTNFDSWVNLVIDMANTFNSEFDGWGAAVVK
jgi:regulator of RNase E activity RraB